MKKSTLFKQVFLVSNTGVIRCAEKYSDFVIAFISQLHLKTSNKYLHCTPGNMILEKSCNRYIKLGVHLNNTGDQLGQQYATPWQAIDGRGADILIVGRTILDSINRVRTAEEYQKEGYQVYEELHKI